MFQQEVFRASRKNKEKVKEANTGVVSENDFHKLSHWHINYFTGKTTTTQKTCGADQFQCKSGICKWVDDEDPECFGPCIPNSWVNDDSDDCNDGSDESEYFTPWKY